MLDDLSISKKHSVISYYNNVGFVMRDTGSKHGTFIDNKRLGVTSSDKGGNGEKGGQNDERKKEEKNERRDDRIKGESGRKGGETETNVENAVSEKNEKYEKYEKNNNGVLLSDGMTVQIGRVICRVYKIKQSSIISSG